MPLVFLEPVSAKIKTGDILDLLCHTGGISRQQIGTIEMRGGTAAVEVPARWQLRLVRALQGAELGGRRVRIWTDGAAEPGQRPDDHFERLLRLMDLEAEAEAAQALEARSRLSPAAAEGAGSALVQLAVADMSAGLGGRLLLTLVKRNRTLELPWTRIGVGSPVFITPHDLDNSFRGLRGVVSRRSADSVVVAVDSLPDEFDDEATWRIDLAYDEVARLRQRTAMDRTRAATSGRLAELRKVLLGDRPPSFRAIAPPAEIAWFDTALDVSQRGAVQFALEAEDVAIIHGPPGTGKTTAVTELIRQAVSRGEKVLACAPSHVAVDNILERLVAAGVSCVRLGHPARVAESLREHSLDMLVEAHEDLRLSRKLIRDALNLQRKANRYTRAKPEPGAKAAMRREARELFADARRIERQTVQTILDEASVLCATTTGLDDELLADRTFDLVVIDEAGQSTEPPCWIPLTRAGRVVLAGDHCQLPPTVIAPAAVEGGFAVSLLERLAASDGERLARRLSVQYRMHTAIMDFSSLEFYEATLVAHESVAGHRLVDLPDITPSRLTEVPMEFIDTAGAGWDEQTEPDGESRFNPQEAQLVCRYVTGLLAAGVQPEQIAVIAPYSAQVRLLRELLRGVNVEIDSVDGFQGREKEVILVTMVRSNPAGEIGFLADTRRMNVAMTRARRKLVLIGDSATLGGDPFYSRLFQYVEALGSYRTVWEEE